MSKCWAVRVGPGGQYAEVARKNGFVAIEWHELGDLSWYVKAKDPDTAWKRLLREYGDGYQASGVKASIGAGQVARFAREIQTDDIVLTPNTPQGVVYIGRVTGDFEYIENPTDGCTYRQRRPVEWLMDLKRRDLPQPLLSSLGSLATVFSMERAAAHIHALLGTGPTPVGEKSSTDVIEHVLKRLHDLHPKQFEEFVSAYLGAIGFEAAPGPYVADGGIDVSGTLEAEGLATVLLKIQVKRTRSSVGNEVVLKTRGALGVDEQGAVITLGKFTEKAEQEAVANSKKRITLVDGDSFASQVLEHWESLPEEMQALLGVMKKDAPVRERFAIDAASSPGT